MNGNIYIISVAAELAGLHPQTLRTYERHGLIQPQRTPGGVRRYNDTDIVRLARITQLAAAGVTHSAIQRILDLEDEVVELRAACAHLRAQQHNTPKPSLALVPVKAAITLYATTPGVPR
jgi:MerR family transcriptional regulator/heat shock protein HspR